MPPGQGNWSGQMDWLKKYITPYLEYSEIKKAKRTESSDEQYVYIKIKNGSIIYLHVGSYVDFYIDINGLQKPNKLGEDQFYTYLDINQAIKTNKFLRPGIEQLLKSNNLQ